MSLLPYIHPIVGGLVIAFLIYVGSLGLRARNDRRRATALLEQHARLAPVMYVLTLVTWLAGVGSTWLWRDDLELASSTHFRFGCAMAIALTLSWLTSRWLAQSWARAIHPWFGAAAMLLAAAQVFFGLQITP